MISTDDFDRPVAADAWPTGDRIVPEPAEVVALYKLAGGVTRLIARDGAEVVLGPEDAPPAA